MSEFSIDANRLGAQLAASLRRLNARLRAPLPLKVHLAFFAGLLIVPAFILSAFLLRETAGERRREAESRIAQLANDLADDVSNELERSITVLRTLSYSASLQGADFAAFHRQSSLLAGVRDNVIVLVTPEGEQLVNTAVPWGTELTAFSDPDALRIVVETQQPYVTDLFWGRLRNRHVVNVLYPIMEGARLRHILALSLTPERVKQLLDGQNLGPEWTTGVSDRKGVVVARSRAHEQFVGTSLGQEQRTVPKDLRKVQSLKSIDGRDVVRAVAFTRVGNWMVAAAVGADHLGLLAFKAVENLIIGSIMILGLAAFLVALYGRQLAAALDGITHAMDGTARSTIIAEANVASERLAQASRALRHSEERFRSIYQNAATGIVLTSLDGRFEACNPAFSRILGYAPEELRGQALIDYVHPDDRDRATADVARLLRQEIPLFEMESRYVARDRRSTWVNTHVSLTRDSLGQPTAVVTLVTDMSERHANERALAIALQRSKIAQQAARAALYEHAPAKGEVIYDASIGTVVGYSAEEASALPDGHRSLIHPDDLAAASDAIKTGLADGQGYDIDYRLRHQSGQYLWVHDRASVLKGGVAAQDRVIGMLLDVSEQKGREAHINLLLREINHRSKNMLGLVQAIARQTIAANPGEFMLSFSERIQALSANQDLLVRNEWGGVDLNELIDTQLAYIAATPGERIRACGPKLQLSPASAQVLGMVLHELATNASKYGALSNADGKVHIDWSIAGRDDFRITWRERGGPPVSKPARPGFGSTVIGTMARMGLEADVTIDYAPEGLTWTLTCPLGKVLDKCPTPAPAPATPSPRGALGA